MTAPAWTHAASAHRRWVTPAAVGAVAVAGCAGIALADPGDGGTPVCWSSALFGVDCPLCGGMRTVNAMVRGDWAAAADHNVVLVVVLPVLAAAWAAWMFTALRDRPAPLWVRRLVRPPLAAAVAFGVLLLAFSVVRNVGGAEWAEWLAAASYRS